MATDSTDRRSPLRCRLQHRRWIDRLALPPIPNVVGARDREVQVRHVGIAVPATPYIAEHITFVQYLAFRQSAGVRIQMRVVVDEALCRAGDVHRQSACLAREQLDRRPVVGGVDWGSARGENVERLVLARAATQLVEGVGEFVGRYPADGDDRMSLRQRHDV